MELFLDGVRGFYFQAKLTDSHVGYLRGEGLERKSLKMVANIQAHIFLEHVLNSTISDHIQFLNLGAT